MIQIIKPPTKTYRDTKMRKHFRCKHCGTEWIADPADYDAKKLVYGLMTQSNGNI